MSQNRVFKSNSIEKFRQATSVAINVIGKYELKCGLLLAI